MTTFDRYLFRRFLHTYAILFVTLFGLYVVIDGFTNIDGFQEGTDEILVVLSRMGYFYGYQSSLLFDLMGPMVAVASVMVVAALLVKNSEYQPVLAAGVPLVRLAVPFVAGLLVVTVVAVANQELVIPRIAHRLQGSRSELKAAVQQVDPTHDYATGVLISGKSVDLESRQMAGAEFILPAPELVGELTTLTAPNARFVPQTTRNPAGWVLSGPSIRYKDLPLTDRGMEIVRPVLESDEIFVVSQIGFDVICNRSRSANWTATADLVRRIRNPALSRQTARDQMLLLHRRLVQPLLNLAAGLACLPLIIRKESRSLVGSLATAAVVQGLLFGLLHGATLLGQSGLVAGDVAAWIPVIVSGTAAAWMTGYAQT